MPLRGLTPAANFAYAFVAVTIVVGELGGRAVAVATALASALSLDFFLTEPYLRLAIHDKHDLLAFFGLAACGLLAAGFANRTLAGSQGASARPVPDRVLDAQTLLALGTAPVSGDASLPLPADGARLALVIGQRPLGWLDLYGNGAPASPASRQALAAVARAVAALLATTER